MEGQPRYCTSCGHPIIQGASFCSKCGAYQERTIVPTRKARNWKFVPYIIIVAVLISLIVVSLVIIMDEQAEEAAIEEQQSRLAAEAQVMLEETIPEIERLQREYAAMKVSGENTEAIEEEIFRLERELGSLAPSAIGELNLYTGDWDIDLEEAKEACRNLIGE